MEKSNVELINRFEKITKTISWTDIQRRLKNTEGSPKQRLFAQHVKEKLSRHFSEQKGTLAFQSHQKRFKQVKSMMEHRPKTHQAITSSTVKAKLTLIRKEWLKVDNRITTPSIPDSQRKFGYVQLANGEKRILLKDIKTLEKQRAKRNEYSRTLVNEMRSLPLHRSLSNEGSSLSNSRNIMKNLREILEGAEIPSVSERNDTSFSLEASQNSVRPRFKLLQTPQQEEAKKRLENSRRLSNQSRTFCLIQNEADKPGPGAYNYDLNTIKQAFKKTKFQYFNSTQIRFSGLSHVASDMSPKMSYSPQKLQQYQLEAAKLSQPNQIAQKVAGHRKYKQNFKLFQAEKVKPNMKKSKAKVQYKLIKAPQIVGPEIEGIGRLTHLKKASIHSQKMYKGDKENSPSSFQTRKRLDGGFDLLSAWAEEALEQSKETRLSDLNFMVQGANCRLSDCHQ